MKKLMTVLMAITLACGASNIVATELIDAVKAGNSARVEELVRQGADRGERDANGQTALMHAAKAGNWKMTQLLLKEDHGCSFEVQDNAGKTALIHAAQQGYIDIVKILLPHCDSYTVDQRRYTALMYAVQAPKNSLEIVKLLLKHKLTYECGPGYESDADYESKKAYKLAIQSGHKATARAIRTYRFKRPIVDVGKGFALLGTLLLWPFIIKT